MILDDKAMGEIKQRAEKATVDWHLELSSRSDMPPVITSVWMGQEQRNVLLMDPSMLHENAEFVVHAREDIPALLDTVTFWKGRAEELEKLRDQFNEMREVYNEVSSLMEQLLKMKEAGEKGHVDFEPLFNVWKSAAIKPEANP